MRYSIESLLENVDSSVIPTIRETLAQPEQYSHFAAFPEGFTLWFRYLNINDEELTFGNLSFIYINKNLYEYSFENKDYLLLEGGILQLIEELENYLSKNEFIVKQFRSEIEKLEDLLYERNIPSVFMDIWFNLKKELSRIDRFLERHTTAIIGLLDWNKNKEEVVEIEIKDLYKKTQYLVSNVRGGLSRLDSLHHYYSSIKNDKLNGNIYLLTLVSGVFLPLNLIVGFFGMNTKGLFFEEQPHGTILVVYTLIGVLTFSIVGHSIFKLIDKFFLRTLLGRTTLYKKISNSLAKIEKTLGGDL